MNKGMLWILFIWVIFCIIYFGFKWIKEKRKEVNYIDVFESMKKIGKNILMGGINGNEDDH